MTVDGTDFQIQEPSPFESRWYSHKFKGPGLRYEVAVSILGGDIVHTNGPFPCGTWLDISIFRSMLMDKLLPGEFVEADKGYRGQYDKIRTPVDYTTKKEKKMADHVGHDHVCVCVCGCTYVPTNACMHACMSFPPIPPYPPQAEPFWFAKGVRIFAHRVGLSLRPLAVRPHPLSPLRRYKTPLWTQEWRGGWGGGGGGIGRLPVNSVSPAASTPPGCLLCTAYACTGNTRCG